ncbi:MAG: MBL fold metallo-hydrolase [Pseudomonadota bacterium]
MSTDLRIPVTMLGQSGCKLQFPDVTIYLDPYLSDSVRELDSPDLERQVPIAMLPEEVDDADWVLITHEHIDHCDPHTLPKLAAASPGARFVGPRPVCDILSGWGIEDSRIFKAEEKWKPLTDDLQIVATPAAHPEVERDGDGNLTVVGYVLEFGGKKIYLAGDTSARQEIIDRLVELGPIHTAFLPVNEHNFFRGRRGIVGNMSVREAFQFAREIQSQQVVAVHWDMFAINSVEPDEIRLIHHRQFSDFSLLISPGMINLADARISIIIRTLNEARYLGELLDGIAAQMTEGLGHEVVIVDSGSTDQTVKIAEQHGCVMRHITREQFSFGRSLNVGCEAAQGDMLVVTSGHCVPVDEHWLQNLCEPLIEGRAQYTYGRQYSGPTSQYSEGKIFAKYYPDSPARVQNRIFCNNANSAILQSAWEKYGFNEELTGLEDMELAQRLVADGGRVEYTPDAGVYHHHDESWQTVRRRFEREAIALQRIMPNVHVSSVDTARYFTSSVWRDWRSAMKEGVFARKATDIVRYRWNQYVGSYRGNHEHRKLSNAEKEKYFYPD